eukprot:m.262652 g.262652  ORF g.262652 m.262652 type:complete len:147 (+) comp16223_c0_seq2:180-620(+)
MLSLCRFQNAMRRCVSRAPVLQRQIAAPIRRTMVELPTQKPVHTGGGPVSWKMLRIIAVLGGSAAFYVSIQRAKKAKEEEKKKSETVGAPAIGGPFALIDTEEKPFSDKDLLGKWVHGVLFAIIYLIVLLQGFVIFWVHLLPGYMS